MINRLISVAPMMDWTDRHDRYFLRLISPNALLYTEMITTGALIHGDSHRFLQYDNEEHPIALQLGGSDPKALAQCAKMAEDYNYDEINLNVGCPSDRVKNGRFGACLMAEPALVANCVAEMSAIIEIPVTVKCRIGIDEKDSYEELYFFVKTIADAGCKVFIIHARKAWLSGLSPKQNREIPPLRYDVVAQLKKDFPHLVIIVNGGIKTVAEIEKHLQYCDGVMIGREAYTNPFFLADIEKKFFGADDFNRHSIVEKLFPYVEEQLQQNVKLSSITRHILGLFHGQKGGKQWRRYLSQNAHKQDADVKVIQEAISTM